LRITFRAAAALTLALSIGPWAIPGAVPAATTTKTETTKSAPATRPAVARKTTKAAPKAVAKGPDRSRPPALGAPAPLRLPRMQIQSLGNGLTLAVVEMHEAPVVDVTITMNAGAVRDPADLPGLATFTAGMLDEGAGRRNALEIAEQVDFLGASLSTGAGPEHATVNLHVPKRGLADALDLLADVVVRPTFPDSEIARQRDLRKNALLQLRDQPTQIAPIAFNAILFGGGHPYGRPAGGTEAGTAALTHDKVARFYADYYRPNDARMLVVGDITPAEARRMVEARFGEWSRGEVPPLPVAVAPSSAERTIYLVDKPGAAQSVIRIGHVGVARSTPDYFALGVLNSMLGGSFTSRLNQNLRETHGYTYGASSAFDMRRLPGPFRASASVVTAKTDSALIEFMRELRRIRDEPVPASELAKAKAYIGLSLPGDFETTAGAAGRYLDLLQNDLPTNFYDSYLDRLNAVTALDVQAAAKRYLDPEHFAIVIVGDRSQIEPGLKAIQLGAIQSRDLWGQAIR
jgi:predicted Zn-dependent peptidase